MSDAKDSAVLTDGGITSELEVEQDYERHAHETGARSMVLNMGPQHPSTHGVLRLLLELDGETIREGRARYRLSAHRHRKGIRGQDLPAGRHADRPHRLPGAAFE